MADELMIFHIMQVGHALAYVFFKLFRFLKNKGYYDLAQFV